MADAIKVVLAAREAIEGANAGKGTGLAMEDVE